MQSNINNTDQAPPIQAQKAWGCITSASTTNNCVIRSHLCHLSCALNLKVSLADGTASKHLLYISCIIYQQDTLFVVETDWREFKSAVWFFLSSVLDFRLAHWPGLSIPVVSPCPKIEAEAWELPVSASLADNHDSTGNFAWFSILSRGVSIERPNIGSMFPNRHRVCCDLGTHQLSQYPRWECQWVSIIFSATQKTQICVGTFQGGCLPLSFTSQRWFVAAP